MTRRGFDERASTESKYRRECSKVDNWLDKKRNQKREILNEHSHYVKLVAVYKKLHSSDNNFYDVEDNLRVIDVLDSSDDYNDSGLKAQAVGYMTVSQIINEVIKPDYEFYGHIGMEFSDDIYEIRQKVWKSKYNFYSYNYFRPDNTRDLMFGDKVIVTVKFFNEGTEELANSVRNEISDRISIDDLYPDYPDDAFTDYKSYPRTSGKSRFYHAARKSIRNDERMTLDDMKDEYNTYGNIENDDIDADVDNKIMPNFYWHWW